MILSVDLCVGKMMAIMSLQLYLIPDFLICVHKSMNLAVSAPDSQAI